MNLLKKPKKMKKGKGVKKMSRSKTMTKSGKSPKIAKTKMIGKAGKIPAPKSPKANRPSSAFTPKFKGKSAFGTVNDGMKKKRGDGIGRSETDMQPMAMKTARRKRLEGVRI